MKNNDLFELFVEQLQDMSSSENQIVKGLPKFIEKASNEDLKKARSSHLEETKKQVKRIDRICTILNAPKEQKLCRAMQGILQEANEMTENKEPSSPTLDAAIIASAQKVEHYEIATYSSLKSFAKQLDLDEEVVDLIEETLNEETAADKKLTKIAEGSIFTSGVNKLAASGAPSRR